MVFSAAMLPPKQVLLTFDPAPYRSAVFAHTEVPASVFIGSGFNRRIDKLGALLHLMPWFPRARQKDFTILKACCARLM
jgi:hypothetical protein